MTFRPILPIADPHVSMPASESSRLDRLDAVIASLLAEVRRLQCLGLEKPLAECRRQLRYWEFVRAILTLAPAAPDLQARREAR